MAMAARLVALASNVDLQGFQAVAAQQQSVCGKLRLEMGSHFVGGIAGLGRNSSREKALVSKARRPKFELFASACPDSHFSSRKLTAPPLLNVARTSLAAGVGRSSFCPANSICLIRARG